MGQDPASWTVWTTPKEPEAKGVSVGPNG
jgi:hypothetical protein